MFVYLLRHGIAAQTSPDGPRALTEKGQAEVALVAEHFKKKGLKVTQVWHSPKTRAIQTAQVFLKVVGEKGIPVEEKKQLKPEGDDQEILEEINQLKEGSLLLVTHMPFVAGLASLLAEDSPNAQFAFPTAGLAAFERKNQRWKWLWSWDPSELK
jgi:phosphohistidine phosphatase